MYVDWIAERESLARELAGRASPWRYADGIIPLCVSINAMSSSLWIEDTRNDKNRFIEIVARFGGGNGVDPTMVSHPLLARSDPAWAAATPVTPINFLLTSDDDLSEAEAVQKHPEPAKSDDLKRKDVRKFSYASLLYSEIRCGFIHTYQASKSATSSDATRAIFNIHPLQMTYNNAAAPAGWKGTWREIYFPLDWVSTVAKNIATAMDAECQKRGKGLFENLGAAFPATWWAGGA